MIDSLSDEKIQQLADMVRDKYGLDFAQDRWRDLRRVVENFSSECGRFSCAGECLDYIVSPHAALRDLELFINSLTIGETYFFRDPQALDVLEREVLRKKSGLGSGMGGAVRIWSMACATGEEPYTMAMICRRSNVRSEIFGTDIDSRALVRAREGHYRKWSFRSDSTAFRDMYFSRTGGNDFLLDKSVRDMVSLSRFNLVGDEVPSSLTQMDIILCRNVLMYFSASGVDRVLDKIWSSLSPDGVLLVTPSESGLILTRGRFEPVSYGPVMLFRKNEKYVPGVFPSPDISDAIESGHEHDGAGFFENQGSLSGLDTDDSVYPPSEIRGGVEVRLVQESPQEYGAEDAEDVSAQPEDGGGDLLSTAVALREQGDAAGAMNLLRKGLEGDLDRAGRAAVLFAMAGIKADTGLLDEAAGCCERSIELDRVAPEPHFLLGQIRMLQGRFDEAVSELRNAVFLNPAFIMAHVMLGSIYMENYDIPAAARHYRTAMQELQSLDRAETVPHSDGTSVDGLMGMIMVVQRNLF
ncbi:CheR family methyltransferase [Maridesulfovibrio sp. FT414]|uniref:CheR family methyltransferase n=1 Tax=Maridesulfovibrio sp. FT414 TaxID=2979469 RepID=UPI003D806EB8